MVKKTSIYCLKEKFLHEQKKGTDLFYTLEKSLPTMYLDRDRAIKLPGRSSPAPLDMKLKKDR